MVRLLLCAHFRKSLISMGVGFRRSLPMPSGKISRLQAGLDSWISEIRQGFCNSVWLAVIKKIAL